METVCVRRPVKPEDRLARGSVERESFGPGEKSGRLSWHDLPGNAPEKPPATGLSPFRERLENGEISRKELKRLLEMN